MFRVSDPVLHLVDGAELILELQMNHVLDWLVRF